jgi:hypothetical protein
MIPYLDSGFLLAILLKTDGAAVARALLARAEPPFAINSLHQLHAENLLKQLEKSPDAGRRRMSATGIAQWRWYFAEGFFQQVEVDWAVAFRLALGWNAEAEAAPAPPLLLLQPAIAVTSQSTDYLSFDPRARAVAAKAGLRVLPEKL